MRDHYKEFNLEKMAKVLRVSRAGYYKFLKKNYSKRKVENQRLTQKIKEAYKRSRGTMVVLEYIKSLRQKEKFALAKELQGS